MDGTFLDNVQPWTPQRVNNIHLKVCRLNLLISFQLFPVLDRSPGADPSSICPCRRKLKPSWLGRPENTSCTRSCMFPEFKNAFNQFSVFIRDNLTLKIFYFGYILGTKTSKRGNTGLFLYIFGLYKYGTTFNDKCNIFPSSIWPQDSNS